ncbi:MAG: hypothetical protein P4L39_09045 [Humidesulfovibrio sp.]|nr:hypothetical protein [Humidesulfovibrio sp.]
MNKRILAILAVSSLFFFSCAGGEKQNKGNDAQSDISQLVQKIADAEVPVEISHKILMEELVKLESINSPDEYMIELKTKCGRFFDAEALHCQRTLDKLHEVKNSISVLNVNQQTKDEVASIIGKTIESYEMRKDAIQKASASISSLDYKAKELPASLVDGALLSVKKSQTKAQESAIGLADLCLKFGVTPAQN